MIRWGRKLGISSNFASPSSSRPVASSPISFTATWSFLCNRFFFRYFIPTIVSILPLSAHRAELSSPHKKIIVLIHWVTFFIYIQDIFFHVKKKQPATLIAHRREWVSELKRSVTRQLKLGALYTLCVANTDSSSRCFLMCHYGNIELWRCQTFACSSSTTSTHSGEGK